MLLPFAEARADLFVGKLEGHAQAGHGGVYIPTSYTGTVETYSVMISNERNFSATNVQVILPQGMQFLSVDERAGWKVTVLYPPSVPSVVLIWNGSSIQKGNSEQFAFTVRNPAEIFVYYFVVVQSYEDGNSEVSRPWVQVVNPTNIAGIEFSTIAGLVIVMVLVLPFVERAGERVAKKNKVVST
jgi:uncharacterized repeat protein (TIGR01451 family)